MNELTEGFAGALEALQAAGAALLVTYGTATAPGVVVRRVPEGDFRVRRSTAETLAVTLLDNCFDGGLPRPEETVSIGGRQHRVIDVERTPGSPLATLVLGNGWTAPSA